mmetsp:Transcript_12518/g.36453  ORF Transcript_12518/g.36453 Transcript_12518/m.36453 type:complete len:251 (+) Transcript_12518:520-1272(+)
MPLLGQDGKVRWPTVEDHRGMRLDPQVHVGPFAHVRQDKAPDRMAAQNELAGLHQFLECLKRIVRKSLHRCAEGLSLAHAMPRPLVCGNLDVRRRLRLHLHPALQHFVLRPWEHQDVEHRCATLGLHLAVRGPAGFGHSRQTGAAPAADNWGQDAPQLHALGSPGVMRHHKATPLDFQANPALPWAIPTDQLKLQPLSHEVPLPEDGSGGHPGLQLLGVRLAVQASQDAPCVGPPHNLPELLAGPLRHRA